MMLPMKQIIFVAVGLLLSFGAVAQNWDYVTGSGEYYYGIGVGETMEEADKAALEDLISSISTSVSSEFTSIDEVTNKNGNVDTKSYARSCINTYSQTSLRNTQKQVVGKEPRITVRRWIKCSEISAIYEDRIAKAKDMIPYAIEAEQNGKLDMALQYYYWAYSLIRSTQNPDRVKMNDKVLMNWIPMQMENILSNVDVRFEGCEDNFVDLLFTYKGKQVSSIDFLYSDGRSDCTGTARDGRGMIEMAPGHTAEYYHITLEYEYKGLARGDSEMNSVLDVVQKRYFPKAEKVISAKDASAANKVKQEKAAAAKKEMVVTASSGADEGVSSTQLVEDNTKYLETFNKVVKAVSAREYKNAQSCFTIDGLDMYNKLISYGTGRIVGVPQPVFYKGAANKVVVRGLQMSFSFSHGTKKTFVEDVVFTFDNDARISNVAFGLGDIAQNAILVKPTGWREDTRELILEFMENYKTAYCLKRIDYIESIFHDNATIITGNVARVTNRSLMSDSRVTDLGKSVITYNKQTKAEYIKNLRRVFCNNEFINIRFTESDVMWLEGEEGEVFSIQIAQDYNSSRYADKGYLFLMVDVTNHDEPLIKVRTWQPDKDPNFGLYGPGHFYDF